LRFVIWTCILWTLRREVAGMLQICSKCGKPCASHLGRYHHKNYVSCSTPTGRRHLTKWSELCFRWGLLCSRILHLVSCDWCLIFQHVVVSSFKDQNVWLLDVYTFEDDTTTLSQNRHQLPYDVVLHPRRATLLHQKPKNSHIRGVAVK
jgi:hypothetical protein